MGFDTVYVCADFRIVSRWIGCRVTVFGFWVFRVGFWLCYSCLFSYFVVLDLRLTFVAWRELVGGFECLSVGGFVIFGVWGVGIFVFFAVIL